VLPLPAELTRAQAGACLQTLTAGLQSEAAGLLVIDATALARFDSAALAVLLEVRRQALAVGKTIAIRGMPERLRELAALYGIAALLPAA